jgi:hypothetical protein
MAHRHKKGEIGAAGVAVGRRAALARIGLGVFVASAAPLLFSLSPAQSGVVIGDGDLDNHNDKGDGGGGGGCSAGNGNGNAHGDGNGQDGGRKRVSVRELLEYLANIGKK